jgi:cell division protein FtsI (penicillin-binding protein 3)
MIDEPKGVRYGGVVAAPAFKKIATEAMAIRGVTVPKEERFEFFDEQAMAAAERALIEAEKSSEGIDLPAMKLPPIPAAIGDDAVPDFRGLTLRESITRARRLGLLPQVEGWGRVVDQDPPPGTPLDDLESLELTLSPATRQSLMAEEPSTGSSR